MNWFRSFTVSRLKSNKILQRKGLVYVYLILLIGIFVILVYFDHFITRSTAFVVEARTEFYSGFLHSSNVPGNGLFWKFSHGTICAGKRESRKVTREMGKSGTCDRVYHQAFLDPFILSLNSPLEFTIERYGHGTLKLGLVTKNNNKTPPIQLRKVMKHVGAPTLLPFPVYVRVSTDESKSRYMPMSFPILASRVTIGREALKHGIHNQPMLLSGQVTIYGNSISNSTFVADNVILKYGDIVDLEPNDNIISALVRVDFDQAISTVARSESTSLSIRSFYGSPREEHLSFLQKITNDPLLAALWSAASMLAVWLALFSSQNKNNNGQQNG